MRPPHALSPAAMARLQPTAFAASDPERRRSVSEPVPEPEPEMEPLRGPAARLRMHSNGSSGSPGLDNQPMAKRKPPSLSFAPTSISLRTMAVQEGSSAPDPSLPTFEDETLPLVDGRASTGSPGVGVAINVAKFKSRLRKSVAPVKIESATVVDAVLDPENMRVQYKIETTFRFDDERQVQGQQTSTVLHLWKDLVAFYSSLRERHVHLPELTELDGSDAAQAYNDGSYAEGHQNIQEGRRQALTHMLQIVLQGGEELCKDPAVLSLLAVRHEQARSPPGILGPGWSGRRLLGPIRDRKNTENAPVIPQRVLDQIEAERKFRETHGGDEAVQGSIRTLDMWDIYKKNQNQDRQVHCCAALSYIVYWILLMMQMGKMPNSAGLMKHQEAIEDLVLDEEFPDVSFKKNFHDVMTEQEMWQWADGPLTAAFYPDDTSEEPQPLLYSNVLVGAVHIRQVRVSDSDCTDLLADIDPSARCAPRWNEYYADDSPFGGSTGQTYQSTSFDSILEGPRVFAMSTVGDTASEKFGTEGFSVSLPRGRTNFTQVLQSLRGPGAPFVDKNTRALSFQFNLLNGNDMGMPPFGLSILGFQVFEGWRPYDNRGQPHILAAQVTFVLDATGHWDRVHRIYAMAPMLQYFFGVDWIFWSWLVLWVWILILDIMRYINQGFNLFFKSGLDSAWNRFDLFLFLLMGYTFYVTWEVNQYTLEQMDVLKLNDESGAFTDLMPLRDKMKYMSRVFGIISFLSVIRFLKYLNGIEQISFMWRVVGSAKVDLMAFATVFVLLLLSFTLLCKVLWGASERQFHNLPTTFVNLLRLTVGTLDFDFASMKEHEPSLAPIFLTLFMFVMMLISINFFIAILTESYSKKKEQVSKYIAYKKAEKQMGLMSSNITKIFPSFTVQEHPAPWPDPETTGAKKVLTVAAYDPNGPHDAAHIICLHLFKENIAANATGRTTLRNLKDGIISSQLDGETGHRNDLRRPEVTCAAYLQVQQNVGTATHILFELREGEVVTLKESGTFGKVIKCKLLHHFTRTTEGFFGGVPEKHMDYYANFEVVSVTSWENFDTHPNGTVKRGTRLTTLASDDWSRSDDDALRANSLVLEKWRLSENDLNDEKPLTATELAELLGKSVDAVILRIRLLDHWSIHGITEPPKVLSEKISLPKALICRLWWRALTDSSRGEYSVSAWVLSMTKRMFVCRTGVEADVEAFFRAKINHLQTQCNMRDVEKAKKVFRAANIPVDELTYRMQLYLKLSKNRTDQYLKRTYTYLDDENNTHMQWLRVYINNHYADEINVVMGDDDDDMIDGASLAGSDFAGSAMVASADETGALVEQNVGLANTASGWDVPRAAYRSPGGLRGRSRRTTTLVSTQCQLQTSHPLGLHVCTHRPRLLTWLCAYRRRLSRKCRREKRKLYNPPWTRTQLKMLVKKTSLALRAQELELKAPCRHHPLVLRGQRQHWWLLCQMHWRSQMHCNSCKPSWKR